MSEKKNETRTQWLSLDEREVLYKEKWPEFSKYLLTDHRGLKKAEQINVASHLSKLTNVSVSTVRRDIRIFRQRLIKGKAPYDFAIYKFLMKLKRARLEIVNKQTEIQEQKLKSGAIVLNKEIVQELDVILNSLTTDFDNDSLGELHDKLFDTVQNYRKWILEHPGENPIKLKTMQATGAGTRGIGSKY